MTTSVPASHTNGHSHSQSTSVTSSTSTPPQLPSAPSAIPSRPRTLSSITTDLPPRVSLLDRLAAVAWKPPPPQQTGPPPQALDQHFPFQVACCELCGSVCSPFMLYYRDTSTILYRVQQHCRKLVPQVITQQTTCLNNSRSAQRSILDVTDSLNMIEVLNGPVRSSFKDIVQRSQHCAAMFVQQAKEKREEEVRKERYQTAKMNAGSSLPTTPIEGETRLTMTPSIPVSTNSFTITPQIGTPSDKQHQNTPATVTPVVPPPQPQSSPRNQQQSSMQPPPPPQKSPSHSRSVSRSGSIVTTPSHQLRSKLAGVFSPSSSSRNATLTSASQLPSATAATAGVTAVPSLHPSLALVHPHDDDHEHGVDAELNVHEASISPFVP